MINRANSAATAFVFDAAQTDTDGATTEAGSGTVPLSLTQEMLDAQSEQRP